MDLLEQEPIIPITLNDLFLMGLFNKVTVNMTSCTKLYGIKTSFGQTKVFV